ncbi:hypothetical protein KSP39_PZI007540 [Platanthera zijinensis]|uniref:Uncharacterized protein n=1 Tax=Platanthera zijinensis TaxID=2320716 RepID=A0AAP0BLX6_9ASPA
MLPLRFLLSHRGRRLLPHLTSFGSEQARAFSPESRSRWVATASYTTVTKTSGRILFRQLLERESSTYTYLVADMHHPEKPAVVSLRFLILFARSVIGPDN